MTYNDIKIFEKKRYSKVVFFKIVISLIIAFLPVSNPYNSKIGTIFLTYLATSIIYACFAISKNYLITIILVFLVPLIFVYLDSITKQGYISSKTFMYTNVFLLLLPFLYDSYTLISLATIKIRQQKS
ncbi:hypothetical protein [Vagococcus carniphilus]|uniref:hypothetical protein n=1 Tax=Vagococcus carniphilus TaxID=218144 RepID=UPI003BAAAF98